MVLGGRLSRAGLVICSLNCVEQLVHDAYGHTNRNAEISGNITTQCSALHMEQPQISEKKIKVGNYCDDR